MNKEKLREEFREYLAEAKTSSEIKKKLMTITSEMLKVYFANFWDETIGKKEIRDILGIQVGKYSDAKIADFLISYADKFKENKDKFNDSEQKLIIKLFPSDIIKYYKF